MNKREFVQDTAQKILLAHLASRSVSPDKFEQLAKDIAKMSSALAHELEVSGNGWAPKGADPTRNVRSYTLRPLPHCKRCSGSGELHGGPHSFECPDCHGSGHEIVKVQPR